MQRRVAAFTGPDNLSLAAAHELTSLVCRAIDQQGWCSLVLTGGSSPLRLYELLAEPLFAGQIAWEKVHIFWSDERCVGPDDERSNYYRARICLLEHVPLPPGNMHRMRGEIDPQQAALESAQDIRCFFEGRIPTPCRFPSFDLVLLGMGADGHVASLFPGDDSALHEEEHLVIATCAPAGMPAAQRLSMSLPLLASARSIFFIVFGSEKKPVLDLVLADSPIAQHYPAALISARAHTVWFVAP